MRSLRARALTGGVVWALVVVLIGFFGLASFLDAQTQRQFDDLLRNRHTQVIVALANNAETPELISRALGDPAYTRPLSGEYWQIEDSAENIHVSRSLFDVLLPRPEAHDDGVMFDTIDAATGERLRSICEWITLENGMTWHVQVASSVQRLMEDREALRSNLMISFGAIVLFGIGGAFLLITTMLRPLNSLRRDVLTRWDSEAGLQPDAYPTEVVPLVSDINTLLERNREIVGRSRRQAADLAHAIKTPSAIVRNELDKLGRADIRVDDAMAALDRLDGQLKRSLARMRADGSSGGMRTATDLDEALGRLARAFTALARNQDKVLMTDIAPGLRVRMDQHDFEEVLGNLLDNALKWSRERISLSAQRIGDTVLIVVADDGSGIPQDAYGTATLSGQRLDTSKPGTGLGLAIAADLAHAYGGKVKLGSSGSLGGLEARIQLPATGP